MLLRCCTRPRLGSLELGEDEFYLQGHRRLPGQVFAWCNRGYRGCARLRLPVLSLCHFSRAQESNDTRHRTLHLNV